VRGGVAGAKNSVDLVAGERTVRLVIEQRSNGKTRVRKVPVAGTPDVAETGKPVNAGQF
jgi:Holliday junction resolvase